MLYSTITGTVPYCWTLSDPRGGIVLNKCYYWPYSLVLAFSALAQSYLIFSYLYFPRLHILSFCTSIFHTCIYQYTCNFSAPPPIASISLPVSGRDSVLLNRLRIGHTRFTQFYLLSGDDILENLGLPRLTTRRVRSDLIQTFKIVNKIDKVDKSLFFEIGSGSRKRHSSKLCKNVADLTLENMHLVIALLTNGIL